MTRDVQITLISQTVGNTVDEYGAPVVEETSSTIFATQNAVKRNEFYQAQSIGLRPEFTLEIFEFEYNGEKIVELDGVRYNIIRTYPVGGERIELICNDIAEVG